MREGHKLVAKRRAGMKQEEEGTNQRGLTGKQMLGERESSGGEVDFFNRDTFSGFTTISRFERGATHISLGSPWKTSNSLINISFIGNV